MGRGQDRQQWYPKLVVYTYSAAEACVVAEASCRHTCSGRGQGRQPGLGPTVAALVVAGARLLMWATMMAQSHHRHTAVEAGDGGSG